MRAPWHPDFGTCDEVEHQAIYHPGPVAAPWPEVHVDLDAPPRIPFGFQRPAPQRRTPLSRQARAAHHRRHR